MTLSVLKKHKSNQDQMCFSFLDAVPTPPPAPVKKPKRMRNFSQVVSNNSSRVSPTPFEDLCLVLHRIATKHITRSDFEDVGALLHCTKLLKQLGCPVDAPPELQAPLSAQDRALVTHAPQYRLLRSRAIAGLATVADLMFKAPAKGPAEYQRGQRDAYQQASEIAALFLDDISDGV
jgi:hypothetical protein